MENQMIANQNPFNRLNLAGRNVDRETDNNCEYRNLIRILTFTIDTLCNDSDQGEKKLNNIQSLISSLSILHFLVEQRESQRAELLAQNFVDDLNGTRYCAVNNWELERFSEK